MITHLSSKNIPSEFLVDRSCNTIADISPMCYSSVIFFDDAIRYRYIYLVENVSLTTYTAAGTRMDKIQPLFFPNDQTIYAYILYTRVHVSFMFQLIFTLVFFAMKKNFQSYRSSITYLNLNAILLTNVTYIDNFSF